MPLTRSRFLLALGAAVVGIGLVGAGCQTLRQVSQLRKVQFQIDRVSDAQLAGIDLEGIRSYDDIGGMDLARLASRVADGRLPLSFRVHVRAENPDENGVAARLTKMDWTVLLQDRETISGTFDREVRLPPGEPQTVPVSVSMNLVEVFDRNLQGLVDLAAAIGGEGPPTDVALKVQPTVQTPLGPMRYPRPITVVHAQVDGGAAATTP